MFEFLSSPFGLVAVGLGVLAVAVLGLCLWITTLDRRMRGMADGLEAERRKVAEMQMVIGRRNNAARSYGRRPAPAAPAGAPVHSAAAPVRPAATAAAMGAVPGAGAPGTVPAAPPASAPMPAAAAAGFGGAGVAGAAGAACAQQAARPAAAAPAPAPRGAAPTGRTASGAATRRRGGGWAPQQPNAVADQAVDAWIQGGAAGQQPIVMPDKKMSRKARREAERAFAARAAAELEARQARRAQEVAVPRGVPQRGAARPAPQSAPRPYGGAAAPQRPAHGAVASTAAEPVGRGRHAR